MNELKEAPKEAKLIQKELNSLRHVTETFRKYGRKLQGAYREARERGSAKKLYELARNAGYTVREIPIGNEFINTKGQKDIVKSSNSVRIGANDTLYVGTIKGKVADIKDLVHDVGACLLGGKAIQPDYSTLISVDIFNEVVERSVDRTYSLKELEQFKLLKPGARGKLVISETHLLEAVVLGEIPYRAIENI